MAIKAYYAYEKDGDDSTIVFAENASQAKAIAQSCEYFEGARYIDMRVKRMPEADGLYTGLSEIDWNDNKTRVLLVHDFGWSCYEPSWECDNCPAKPYCRWHGEE